MNSLVASVLGRTCEEMYRNCTDQQLIDSFVSLCVSVKGDGYAYATGYLSSTVSNLMAGYSSSDDVRTLLIMQIEDLKKAQPYQQVRGH